MDKISIINALVAHYGNGSKTKFAQFLGITTAAVTNWYLRGDFNVKLVSEKCPDINPGWLLTGEGPMLKVDLQKIETPAPKPIPAPTPIKINGYTPTERLEMLVEHYAQGNKAKFAEMLGVSSGAVSNWYRRGVIQSQLLLAKFPEINPDWLAIGKGEMFLGNIQPKNYDSAEKTDMASESLMGYASKLQQNNADMQTALRDLIAETKKQGERIDRILSLMERI